MEVKTENGGTFNAAGTGSTSLGIIGTVLGGLGVAMGGLLGGSSIFGNRNNQIAWVSQNEFEQEKEYAKLFADYKSELAERYTDEKVIAQAEKEAAQQMKLAQDMLDIGVGVAKLNEQVIADRDKSVLKEQIVDLRIKALEDKMVGAIALESERRVNGDQGLFAFCKGTYVPGQMYMPITSLSPEAMPRYNSFTAPTTTTTTA